MIVSSVSLLLRISYKSTSSRNLLYWSGATISFVNKTQFSTNTMNKLHESLKWNYSADDISSRADTLLNETKSVYDDIGSTPVTNVTFDKVIKRLGDADCAYAARSNVLDFYQHVHPNKVLRDASTTASKKLSEFEVDLSMRQDIYDRVTAVKNIKGSKLTAEDDRFVNRLIKHGQQNGLDLPADVQQQIKKIKKRMTELSIDFQKNLNEENTTLKFSSQDLKGLSDEFLNSLEKENDKFVVTLKYPHYFPIMKKCSVAKTRRAMEIAFNCRCKEENSKYLVELVKLRKEKAKILGFENHAAFILDMRMAKHPEAVRRFLTELAEKLKSVGESDLKAMLKLKADECKQSGEEFDGKINMWDLKYYCTKIEEDNYSVDQDKLKEYFPLDVVTEGLLSIYQQLLSLKFEKVEDCDTWHDDVTLYRVLDATHGGVIGHFYLDLFPREGKYGHAACFGLVPGCLKPDGSRQNAVAAMVANFSKPIGDNPSLLQHDEVETFFHEFGHVMHQICAEAKYEMFSGTKVERDFVEAPSQMLENWCWEIESLRRMSSHYKDGSELPAEDVQKLIKSRNANCGVFYLRQIALSTLDQNIHTGSDVDPAKVYADACRDILGVCATEDTCMPATFGHLAGGYDSQYYGYLWSEVFCFDMFYSRFKKEGILSSKVGVDYRNQILRPGGSIDAAEMLKNFLGRNPNQDAFLLAKGINESKL